MVVSDPQIGGFSLCFARSIYRSLYGPSVIFIEYTFNGGNDTKRLGIVRIGSWQTATENNNSSHETFLLCSAPGSLARFSSIPFSLVLLYLSVFVLPCVFSLLLFLVSMRSLVVALLLPTLRFLLRLRPAGRPDLNSNGVTKYCGRLMLGERVERTTRYSLTDGKPN